LVTLSEELRSEQGFGDALPDYRALEIEVGIPGRRDLKPLAVCEMLVHTS
jgi:hypothetical protein